MRQAVLKLAGTRHRGLRGTGPLSRAPTGGGWSRSCSWRARCGPGSRRGWQSRSESLEGEQGRPAGQGLDRGPSGREGEAVVPRSAQRAGCMAGPWWAQLQVWLDPPHTVGRFVLPHRPRVVPGAGPVFPTPHPRRSPGRLRPEGHSLRDQRLLERQGQRGSDSPRVPGQERGFLWGLDPGAPCLGTPPAHQALGLGPGLLEALAAPAFPGSRPGSGGSAGSNSPPSVDLGWPQYLTMALLPGPGVRGLHCLAWRGSDLALWPGVTVCPRRISPH